MTETVVATCADTCSRLGTVFTWASGGDAGGAEAGAHSYLSGAPAVSSAAVFIVHTHSQVYKVNTLSGTTPNGGRKLTFSSASCSANNSSPR